jgi:hypothetical protein
MCPLGKLLVGSAASIMPMSRRTSMSWPLHQPASVWRSCVVMQASASRG